MALGSEFFLKVNKGDSFGENLVIQGSGQSPFIGRANAVEFKIGVFSDDGETPADLSDISTLSLVYMPVSRTDTALASETVSITTASFTKAQWDAGTHYHALCVFTETEMNPTLDGGLSKEFWMVCHGIKTSDSGETTFGAGAFTIHEDGTANAVSAPAVPGTGITSAQAQALIDASLIDNVFEIPDDLDGTKKISFQASGITTSTTRLITMPDNDVDLADVSPEHADDVFRIQSAGDLTKELDVDCSAITTGTVRTITMPDADVDLGNVSADVSVSDLANGTDGELITWDAAGIPDTVAVGTVGQVLTSGGAGVAPSFAAAGFSQSYKTIGFPPNTWYPAITDGAAAIQTRYSVCDVTAYSFSTAAEEEVYINFQLPDDYGGGVLRWNVNWDALATASGTAVFGLSGGAYADSDSPATLGAENTITDTLITVGDNHKSPNDATGITLAGSPSGGQMCILKFVVKDTSTIGVNVTPFHLNIQYQTNATAETVYA